MTDDFAPLELECRRCGRVEAMRFHGCCRACRDELRATMRREAATIAVAEYEPKMNVTPNAVALKGD